MNYEITLEQNKDLEFLDKFVETMRSAFRENIPEMVEAMKKQNCGNIIKYLVDNYL